MSTFYVFSAGCIRRGLDTIRVQRYLEANGWGHTEDIALADLVVIATCGVVRLNEINSIRAVAKAITKRKKSAQVVATGCLPVINPNALRELGEVTFVPTGQLDKLDDIIKAGKSFASVDAPDSITDNPAIVNYLVARSYCRRSRAYKWLFHRFSMNSRFLAASIRAFKAIDGIRDMTRRSARPKVVPYFNIKIADGCLSECTYCATRYATGTLRSRPVDVILAEFRRGLAKGYKVFQLISEDTGCYGLDIGSSLADLLERMFALEGDFKLVIIDCCPQWLVEHHDTIMPVLVRNQDRIKEMFIPVQSGSDVVLRRMKRMYLASQVQAVLKELRERAPAIALRTTLLVGFPGETEEDFGATKRFVAGLDLAEVTVNRYEDRPGTESSKMAGKVAQDIIENRARILARDFNCNILS